MHSPLPWVEIVDAGDVASLAADYTRPAPSVAYRDDDDVKDATQAARRDGSVAAWKHVHKLRRSARKRWKINRLSAILGGDWLQYRQLQRDKKRCRGWWGDLLADRSSRQLATEITEHLEEKMCDRSRSDWNRELQAHVDGVNQEDDFKPFVLLDMRRELQSMRCRSAVGPDKIGVHLLWEIANHGKLCYGLLDLINHIVRTRAAGDLGNQLPGSAREVQESEPSQRPQADLCLFCFSEVDQQNGLRSCTAAHATGIKDLLLRKRPTSGRSNRQYFPHTRYHS